METSIHKVKSIQVGANESLDSETKTVDITIHYNDSNGNEQVYELVLFSEDNKRIDADLLM